MLLEGLGVDCACSDVQRKKEGAGELLDASGAVAGSEEGVVGEGETEPDFCSQAARQIEIRTKGAIREIFICLTHRLVDNQ
jgi:hypothetical protein